MKHAIFVGHCEWGGGGARHVPPMPIYPRNYAQGLLSTLYDTLSQVYCHQIKFNFENNLSQRKKNEYNCAKDNSDYVYSGAVSLRHYFH